MTLSSCRPSDVWNAREVRRIDFEELEAAESVSSNSFRRNSFFVGQN